mgnify:CR=1 FL=1
MNSYVFETVSSIRTICISVSQRIFQHIITNNTDQQFLESSVFLIWDFQVISYAFLSKKGGNFELFFYIQYDIVYYF